MSEFPKETVEAWRAAGLISEATLGGRFAEMAQARPHARLIVVDDAGEREVTLGWIYDQARRVAGGFAALGLKPGDVIGVQMPNRLETLLAHAAAGLAGLVALPIVHIYGEAELSFILAQSGARAIVTPDAWKGADYLARVRGAAPSIVHIVVGEAPAGRVAWPSLLAAEPVAGPAPAAPDDLALLIYTSGTTGAAKGVRHSHRTLMAELLSAPEDRSPDDFNLSPWPPGHVAGVLSYQRFWVMGSALLLMETWDGPKAAELIERHKVVSTSGTPFHLSSLLDAAQADRRDISSLVDYMAGGTMIPPALIDRCAEFGLNTYRCYGMSELPTISRGSPEDPLDKRTGTDGRLCPGVEVRIVGEAGEDLPAGEEGEILARGPERFLGYKDASLDAAVLAPGGWLRTGDVGRLFADGYLAITDRKKDLVIRGGENISSREVEDYLGLMPGVREAAVVGAPDERLGERVCAFVVLAGAEEITMEAVRAHFEAGGLARQKTPEMLIFVDELPRNAAGKVLKPDLRRRLKTPATAPRTRVG